MKTAIAFLLLSALQLTAQDMQSCPMHKEHTKHQADVEKHGDAAMGFPHDKTTHHFRLYSDGGAIEVTVNDATDSQDLQAIRSHLAHIATMFANGDFSTPMFVHSQVPPGVPALKEKSSKISYVFEELPTGGVVRIKSSDPDALKAIHDFLRFQIEDHHTGDAIRTRVVVKPRATATNCPFWPVSAPAHTPQRTRPHRCRLKSIAGFC